VLCVDALHLHIMKKYLCDCSCIDLFVLF